MIYLLPYLPTVAVTAACALTGHSPLPVVTFVVVAGVSEVAITWPTELSSNSHFVATFLTFQRVFYWTTAFACVWWAGQ